VVSEHQAKVPAARAAWERACVSWSKDDGMDFQHTIQLGERLIFKATDLIIALEDALAEQAGR